MWGQATGGRWSLLESSHHINYLELRAAFLASVSHEIRTPLTEIKGFASTLVQPDARRVLQVAFLLDQGTVPVQKYSLAFHIASS